jgi:hypothetical protein
LGKGSGVGSKRVAKSKIEREYRIDDFLDGLRDNNKIINMKIKTVVVMCSLFINVILIVLLVYTGLNGYPEARFGKYGRLKKDITLGRFGENQKIFVLPKGLLVKDVSATGVDYFEPNRFKVIVTTDKTDLVDYTIDQKIAESNHGEYYSADVTK